MLALWKWHHYLLTANYIYYPSTSLIIIVNDMSSENSNHKVRFTSWLYHLCKLFSHHRYGPLKTNMHPQVLRMLHCFLIFLYK